MKKWKIFGTCDLVGTDEKCTGRKFSKDINLSIRRAKEYGKIIQLCAA